MALNREHLQAIIFYNFQRGLTQQQCNEIFGYETPSRTSVYRWFVDGEFKRARSSVQDEFREGHVK